MRQQMARTISQRPTLKDCETRDFVEGHSVAIEYRWGVGHNERMAALAAELVALRVAVIVSIMGATGALAAKRLTSTIPIVFLTSGDAVQWGPVVDTTRRQPQNYSRLIGLGRQLCAACLVLLR